jgi:hypothetical protein
MTLIITTSLIMKILTILNMDYITNNNITYN